MNRQDQIDKMAYTLMLTGKSLDTVYPDDCEKIAAVLYDEGCRMQSEGEWIDADPNGHLYRFTCSLCEKTKLGRGTPYCSNCGAKMKGV